MNQPTLDMPTAGPRPGAAGRRIVPIPAAVCMSLAAVSLGLAIHLLDGEYTPAAIGLVTVAIVANLLGLLSSDTSSTAAGRTRFVLLAGLLLQFALLFSTWPGVDLPHHGRAQLVPFY